MFQRIIFGKGYNDYEVVQGFVGSDYIHYKDIIFSKWHSMIRRCYSKYYQERGGTTNYKNVSVCDDWLKFSNFWLWAKDLNYEGKDLDKDIIGGAIGVSQYSPDTCAFIDSSLNKFLCIRSNARGLYPVGATIDRKSGMFISRCMVGGGKRVSLGYFKTPEEAHRAWQQAKLDYGRELQSEQTDQRVFNGLDVILHRLEQDILEGNITERLV